MNLFLKLNFFFPSLFCLGFFSIKSFVYLACLLLACEKGWLANGKQCYKKFVKHTDWKRAKSDCQKNGAHLVKIDSKKENEFLFKHLLSKKGWHFYEAAWIGLSYRSADREFKWTDGTKPVYTNWGVKQPVSMRSNNQNCCLIANGMFWIQGARYKGTWLHSDCNWRLKYICEKPQRWKVKTDLLKSHFTFEFILIWHWNGRDAVY